MARLQLMRKRKLGTVDSPFVQMSDTSSSDCTDSESKRFRTTALSGEKGPRTSEYIHWRDDQVVSYLSSNCFDKNVCAAFKVHQLKGSHIPLLTEEMLDKMGIKTIGVQKDILALFRALQQQDDRKVFNDPIHGHFELHPLLVRVIDTPQFQRLRNIKQLGGGYYVFPGASHNRFEHSLGVCHIAGEFVENLQRKQPELGITEVDVLCVMMAGLCHDLGHGPFSHLFDSLFIPRARPNSCKKWRHEDASVTMLDHLLEENNLRLEFSRYGLHEQDIVFIKEIIAGPLRDKEEQEDEGIEEEELEGCLRSSECPVTPDKQEAWPYSGRTVEKSFLYEIVANKRNGVDVDKWDYFARDCHCLGIPNNFDMLRYMKFARVISVNGRRQICARDKEVNNLYEMFHTRDGLHRRAYQHKTSNVVELMITEALLEANDHLLLPGKDGRQVKMSEAIYDMIAYSRLTDGVIHQIMMSSDLKLEKAKQLILQIENRKLYKCVGQTQPSRDMTLSEVDIQHQLVDSLTPSQLHGLPELTPADFLVQVVKFDYGMRDKNPIDMMRFYVKGQPDRAVKVRKDQVSQMLPHTFQEKSVRVYCKKLDQDSNSAAWKYFIAWCNKQKQFVTPKGYISSSQDEKNDDEEDDDEDRTEEGEGDLITPYGTPYGTPAKTLVESDEEHSGGAHHGSKKQSQLLIEEVKKKLFSQ